MAGRLLASVPLVDGVASMTMSPPPAGLRIVALYRGDLDGGSPFWPSVSNRLRSGWFAVPSPP
jgi:hypothetical protein